MSIALLSRTRRQETTRSGKTLYHLQSGQVLEHAPPSLWRLYKNQDAWLNGSYPVAETTEPTIFKEPKVMDQPHQDLIAARQLITDPAKWTQGCLARDINGTNRPSEHPARTQTEVVAALREATK